MISQQSIAAFSTIFLGYITHSLLLQYFFYFKRGSQAFQWKIQSNKADFVNALWGFPLFSAKPGRAPYHRVLITLNLIVASCFAAFTTECAVRGWNLMDFTSFTSLWEAIPTIAISTSIAVAYENIAEYYWHRLMHMKYFYRYFHKLHHFYKSPEPFDDMYIHPVEAFGYYCILYAPPFLFRIHYLSFIMYMIIMGICGVLDHSGIDIEVPLLYHTADHDKHHEKFEVNYAFPFPYMDILHGTYDGMFAGQRFSANPLKRS